MMLMELLMMLVIIIFLASPAVIIAILIRRDRRFRSSAAPRLSRNDFDADGLYIGPVAHLYCARSTGLTVEGEMGRVTINNNLWVDGILDVEPGTQLNVLGTAFFGDLAPGTAERFTAADKRSSVGPHYVTTGEWEAVGELKGPGTLRRARGDHSV